MSRLKIHREEGAQCLLVPTPTNREELASESVLAACGVLLPSETEVKKLLKVVQRNWRWKIWKSRSVVHHAAWKRPPFAETWRRRRNLWCEWKTCPGPEHNTAIKGLKGGDRMPPRDLTDLEAEVKLLSACLLVPLFESTRKKEVIILVVSGCGGSLSEEDLNS